MATFKNFQFQPFIMEAIQDKGFMEPTPVQEKLIPLIKKGKTLLGNLKQAQEKRIPSYYR